MRKEYDFKKGKRGAVLPTPAGKTRITIRLDDVCRWPLSGEVTCRSNLS
jgi:hypothetical protein